MRLLVVAFLAHLSLYGQGQSTFSALKYDSLVIYDFDWRGRNTRHTSIVDEHGKLPSTIKKRVKLSTNEAKELSERIGSANSYDQITASCFDPHFGMIYYESGQIKAYVTICLACNYPKSNLELPSDSGFSTPMRQYLSAVKKKYGFSHSSIESDIFDKE